MVEIWKPIKNYEELYEVSNLGNVRNAKTFKILCKIKHRQGYQMTSLYKDGKQKSFLIHRLVAIAFIENPKNLEEINHIDENKENNVVSNLEWCDRIYNANYGTSKIRRIKTKTMNGTLKGSKKSRNKGENNPNCKISDEIVKYIRENYKKNDKNFGGVPLSKKFNVSKYYIYRIVSNERRSV